MEKFPAIGSGLSRNGAAIFIATLMLFSASALKPNQHVRKATGASGPATIAPFPITPLVTLPSGETIRCPLQALQPNASSTPQLPPPCPVPGVNDWCPGWMAQPYDGPGHKSDSPGNTSSTKTMATSTDGKLVFVAGTSDQSADSRATNYQVAVIAYDAATGSVVWTTRYTAPAGLQSYAQSLAVGGSRVFVTIY